ncbi:kinase-like domain-containing protein [Lipomyces japonicus]|uniref:kinase-like domain-containing protein n=1 Tax=Lipomyces japonicus TaxID=56871 RepID=UPI0034CE632D
MTTSFDSNVVVMNSRRFSISHGNHNNSNSSSSKTNNDNNVVVVAGKVSVEAEAGVDDAEKRMAAIELDHDATDRPLTGSTAHADGTGDFEVAYSDKKKKSIAWFSIIEDMGQGAYGQVKLAKYRHGRQNSITSDADKNNNNNNNDDDDDDDDDGLASVMVVLKYVTKRRILVDTWIRDRKLGTIPLEIHVLQYLRQYPHRNVVVMRDFFEDDVNYYIEMTPHVPGMDLFDYIELRERGTYMDEIECRSIFWQVASAVAHLHRAGVVHRDIKDENVILDQDGNIKLIDFGSAAYVKDAPFTVFVGTIDYAAPEVLRGQSYDGKKQDVWALGILLYTIIYKENPFYDSNEIINSELRVPYVLSDQSLALIRKMIDRNVDSRPTVDQVLQDPWLKDLINVDQAENLQPAS